MRHRRLTEIARADLSLARLAEAHTDALAILAEAGRRPLPGLYGVWAAESAGGGVRLDRTSGRKSLTGTKMFCSGAGIVDRALITISTPEPRLMDVSLRDFPETIEIDESTWKSSAFADTQTATVSFTKTPVCLETLMGGENWYVERPGFWHGACGPAACWAGGAIALVDYALSQSRRDPHTMAHLGGMCAAAWGLWALLDQAGEQIDCSPADVMKAKLRALSLRHLVEQACADILTRLG
jgi:alkylation response protein AidB-like acyl-CoA dehydrogenase